MKEAADKLLALLKEHRGRPCVPEMLATALTESGIKASDITRAVQLLRRTLEES